MSFVFIVYTLRCNVVNLIIYIYIYIYVSHHDAGLTRKEDFLYTTYYCPHCQALNKPRHSEEHSLTAPAYTPLPTDSLKPMESEVINSSSSTSERGNSPVPLLSTPEIVEEAEEEAENGTPS